MINSGWCQLVTEQAMQKHVASLFASVKSLLFPQRQHSLLQGLCLYKTDLHSGCLSSKYSFTARASCVAAFSSHWCFSIQESPEVRSPVVPESGWLIVSVMLCVLCVHCARGSKSMKGECICKASSFDCAPRDRPWSKASGWKLSLYHFPRSWKCSAALQVMPTEIHCRGEE